MSKVDFQILKESVLLSHSPKLSQDGVWLLLGSTEEYDRIFKETLDAAWRDAARRNRIVTRSAGKKRNVAWPDRITPEEKVFQSDMLSVTTTRSQRKKLRILGKVLAVYDQQSIQKFFSELNEKE